MKDFRNEWFFKQWYSDNELNQLWEWCQKSGEFVDIRLNKHDKWSGFHIEDKDFTIELAGQPTETDCRNWMQRLGFKVRNKID